MTLYGTYLRRNFEPVVLSVQVIVDLCVVLFACWLGYVMGEKVGSLGVDAPLERSQSQMYTELSALIAAVCLVTFHAFGMYSPVKSLLNMEEFKAVAKSTVVSFLVLLALLIFLRATKQDPEGWLYAWL